MGDEKGGQVERNARGARIKADGLSAAKRAVFLATLADRFSVQGAAAAAGASVSAFKQLRERDPGFAADWARAHDHGLEMMEDLLAAAALGQPVPDGFDPAAVLMVVQRHRARAVAPEHNGRVGRVKHVSIAEVERELLRRLAAMKAQRSRVTAAARRRK